MPPKKPAPSNSKKRPRIATGESSKAKGKQKITQARDEGSPHFEDEVWEEKFKMWKTNGFGEVRYLDLAALAEFGNMKDKVLQLVTCLPEWEYFFLRFREPTYVVPTWEILATLSAPREAHKPHEKNIHFTVFGEKFDLSADELAVHLGFYTEDTFHSHPSMRSLTDVPIFPGRQALWDEISLEGSEYDPGGSKQSELPPELRIIHNIFAHSFTGRKAAAGVVSKMDLLCLYSIVHRVPIHLGVVMASMFHKHTNKDLATPYIGPFVTKLLKSLGFEDKLKELQPVAHMVPQSERCLVNLKIPRSIPDAMHERAVPAPPPTQPAPVPDSWEQMRAFQQQLMDGLRTDMNAGFDGLNSRFEGFQTTVLQEFQTLRVSVDNLETRVADMWTQWQDSRAPNYSTQGPPEQ
nr:hypothetical protein GOBAR_AA19401 [Ipomoea batatas]